MKKEQTTTMAIHSKSTAKVQNFSEIRKDLAKKDGIFAAAFTRREWRNGRISYLSIIGKFAGVEKTKSGREIVRFSKCAFACQMNRPMKLDRGLKATMAVHIEDIIDFRILEDLPC